MPSLDDLKAAAERWRADDYSTDYIVRLQRQIDQERLADFAATILSLAERPVERETLVRVLGESPWNPDHAYITQSMHSKAFYGVCDTGVTIDAPLLTLADLAAFLHLTRWPVDWAKLMEVVG